MKEPLGPGGAEGGGGRSARAAAAASYWRSSASPSRLMALWRERRTDSDAVDSRASCRKSNWAISRPVPVSWRARVGW